MGGVWGSPKFWGLLEPLPHHRPSPPQLFQELWVENERIREQLQEAELALTQSRLELERLTQVREHSGERAHRGGDTRRRGRL